ncbi:TLDc domain-containing protein [Caerostris extrusa]|uniref:TLDc domain-containing protein n=1 Tax=Caerostris extrusa TaxID=172846 RepID=A0AAV4WA06_CAEEX|nr:TLDc domain-containing protein [Caerostris extrusa]
MHHRERGFPTCHPFTLIDCGIPFHSSLPSLHPSPDASALVPAAISDCCTIFRRKHRLVSLCTSFQNVKRGEICKVPGSTISPAPPGTPTPIRLPHAKPEVFREVLFYLYTGKVILQDCSVFESLSIAQELGIEELRMCCEDHINSTLNVHNACTFLPACLEMENRIPGNKSGRTFLDRYALIHLVSSDYLAMEEEDVWRAVLSWAKHQAGVTQPTAHWTEEERARIAQQMSGVINYVRILLIDSQVFAEEVEPTGAVPMELSLERYRFAALPNKFTHSEDKRIQPRTSLKLFQGSQLLSGEKLHLQRVLNAWFGNSKQMWRLLYRASTHGYSAEAFHYHCDGHNPTFVIVLGAHGELCGGFSDVPWGKTRGRRTLCSI